MVASEPVLARMAEIRKKVDLYDQGSPGIVVSEDVRFLLELAESVYGKQS